MPEENEDRFGQEVRRLRKAAGLTQVQLAERVGLSQPTVANLERGNQQSVGIDIAFRLADALSVPVDHFRPYFLNTPPVAAVGAGVGDTGGAGEGVRVPLRGTGKLK